MVSIPLAQLIEDMEIYPRHAVDDSHVQSLVFALESGATLPPIIADKKSKRVTDGWHRCRAFKRFSGPDAVVEVELVPYASEKEMLLDAVERNATHGRRLDSIDRTRCVLMLRHVGMTDGQIGLAMKLPQARVSKISIKTATAPKSAGQNVPGTDKITLKRSVAHMDGQRLTKSQAEAHATLPGTSFLLVARQLTLALTEGMVNLEDERLVGQLRELQEALGAALG